MANLIEQIAYARGIAGEYIDASGQKVIISDECKLQCLKALGYNVDDQEALAEQYNQEQDALFVSGTEPVFVTTENKAIEITVRLTDNESNNEIEYHVVQEDGTKCQGKFYIDKNTRAYSRVVKGVEYIEYRTNLIVALPLGYHDITFKTCERTFEPMRLIICPRACYKPEEILNGNKVWGPSVQLYALRSEKNWGIGDFGDLKDLIINLAENGAGFVGVNPIHAAYPSNPESASPYSPSSRRWLNVIYINPENTFEFKNNEDAQKLVYSSDFQKKLNALRGVDYVDYTNVMKLKLEVLRKLFDEQKALFDNRTIRGKAYAKFKENGGESLKAMALYDAIMAHFYSNGENAWGWPVWRDGFRKYSDPIAKEWANLHEIDVEFYMYLQFLADEQLEAAHQAAKDSKMAVGIYRDLAVGVSEGSEEIWANGSLYCVKASVGAPPDPLGPLGQNWGLPPMDPKKLVENRYQPIIDLFRSNMQHCGSLRIDHAMSLLRLWWVPPAASAKQGVYVYYRVHDLVGILALESQRNKCLIIGEDLGTVPYEMKAILRDAGIHSYKIFFWEKSETDGGFISPKDYVEQAMSALSTHDMPTIEGWWSHSDLTLGRELGLYDDAAVQSIGNARTEDQQRILDSLHWHGVISDKVSRDARNCPMSKELRDGMQIHMCLGNCALFSTQIEDWLGMDKPVNVPGTSNEYPNWRRKIAKNLSEVFNNREIKSLLKKMTEARLKASNRM